MTSTERIWMTRQDYTRLQTELAALRSRRSIEVPTISWTTTRISSRATQRHKHASARFRTC